MIKLVILAAVSAVLLFTVNGTAFASTECYGIPASTRETPVTTQNRFGQQYYKNAPGKLLSVSVNIGSTITPGSGNTRFQIQETTAGLPNGNVVAGSEVTRGVGILPYRAIGLGQSFECGNIPDFQKYTFASPVELVTGDLYALIIYADIGADASVGWVQGIESIVPEKGLDCVGSPCISHTGWGFTTYLGYNFDMVYSVETDIVDAVSTDGKIDSHIDNLREYLKLEGDVGGTLFSLAVIAIIFILGLRAEIPFIILAMINAILAGVFARKDILPPWILLAVVALAGIALVFMIAGGRKTTDES